MLRLYSYVFTSHILPETYSSQPDHIHFKMLFRSLIIMASFASVSLAGTCRLLARAPGVSPAKILTLTRHEKAGGLIQYTNDVPTESQCSTKAGWYCKAEIQFNYMYESNKDTMHRELAWKYANPGTSMVASVYYKTGTADHFHLEGRIPNCQDQFNGHGDAIERIEVRNYAA